MSLSDRRRFLLGGVGLAGLTACRMEPARRAGSPVAALFGQIEVAAPGDVNAYEFVQNLEERLGRGGPAVPYVLSYSLEFTGTGLGTDPNGVNQRVHLAGRAKFALRRRGEEGVLTEGAVRNFTGLSTTANTVSSAAASEDARLRLLQMLADDVVERLLLASPDIAL